MSPTLPFMKTILIILGALFFALSINSQSTEKNRYNQHPKNDPNLVINPDNFPKAGKQDSMSVSIWASESSTFKTRNR